jgi:hypothetical protein
LRLVYRGSDMLHFRSWGQRTLIRKSLTAQNVPACEASTRPPSPFGCFGRLTNERMEHKSRIYKIVMDDGQDTEVLGRLTHLDLAGPVYWQPSSNIQMQYHLRHGAQMIKRTSQTEAGAADRARARPKDSPPT